VNVVGTLPAAATLTLKPDPCLLKVGVTAMFSTSGRCNSALKISVARELSCACVRFAASRDSISAVESTADCIAALSEFPRL